MASNAVDFLISIEQQLKGEDAVTELQKTERAITDGIKSYRQYESSVEKANAQLVKLGGQLGDARAKMQQAMQAGNAAAFWKAAGAVGKLEEKERALKSSASSATDALEKQKQALMGQASALEALRKQEKAQADAAAASKKLKAEALESLKRHEKQQAAFAAARKSYFDNERRQHAASSKSTLAIAQSTRLAGTEIFGLETAFKDLGGPLGSAVGRLFEMGEAVTKLGAGAGPLGLAAAGVTVLASGAFALAAGATVATVAFVALTAATLKLGVSLANTAREQRLTLEAMLGSKAAADRMAGAMRKTTDETAIAHDRLMQLTESLTDAKLSGSNMTTALNALAKREQALGSTKGTDELIGKLKSGQLTAGALARDIEKKYGDIVNRKMIGLDQSMVRLKANFAGLFSGLKIDGLLASISRFVDLFNETSSVGRALKFVFEKAFQPLVDAAEVGIPMAVFGMARLFNTALRFGIWLAPIGVRVRRLYNEIARSDVAHQALTQLGGLLPVLGVGLLFAADQARVFGGALMFVLDNLVAVTAGFNALSTLANNPFGALDMARASLQSLVTSAESAIASLRAKRGELFAIGASFIDGLVQGVKSKIPSLGGAMDGVVGTMKGIASKLDIRSPSRLAAFYGRMFSQGFEVGIEQNNSSLERAVSSMLSGGGRAPATAQHGAGGFHIELVTINVTGETSDPVSLAAEMRKQVEITFRGLALELGVAPQEAT